MDDIPGSTTRVCMAEGTINPSTLTMHFEIYSYEVT
jgi:hypothetical protein